MAIVSMKALLESGVHFGHQTRRWNPKMSKFIFTARNGIHIIDLQKTMQRVKIAYAAMKELSEKGGNVLFVGTKKQAQGAIVEYADKCGMYFVAERWLGGLLTNFKTVSNSIDRLKELEKMQENDSWDAETKKERLDLQRELEKKNKVLCGIKNMSKLPDALFIIDPKREAIAVHEAKKLASIIDEPARVTESQMEKWLKQFDSWDICDICCSSLFVKTPFPKLNYR